MLNNPPTMEVPVSSGNYTGDGTQNRAIPHGLDVIPTLVLFRINTGDYAFGHYFDDYGYIMAHYGNTGAAHVAASTNVTDANDTNFYVGGAGATAQELNANGVVYYWVAFGKS